MGNNLVISNSANTFVVNEDGMTISNDSMEIKLSPDSGIDVFKKTASGDKDVFQVDKNGNLSITGGRITVGDGESMGYIIDGNNGYMASIIKDDKGDPLFELTADGHMRVSGLNLGGTEVPKPSDPIQPEGSDGVVEDAGSGLTGGFFEAAWTLLEFFWVGPYIAIRDLVGKRDTDGWRKIWGYYSKRTISTMLNDIYNSGFNIVYQDNMTSYVTEQIADNNKYLSNLYATKAFIKDNYKPWNDTIWSDGSQIEGTLTYLQNNYQLKSDMSNYYTSSQIDDNFVLNNSLTQHYLSKTDMGVNDNDKLLWQTVTIGSKSYTILTKT